MRSPKQRFALVVVAVVVAIALFLVMRDDGAPDRAPPEQSSEQEQPSEQEEPASEPEEPDRAEMPIVRIRDGELRDELLELDVLSGDEVRFEVDSDTPGEVHVHGYEVYEDVGVERTATITFEAEIEGTFEIEFHRATDGGHVEIAALNVHPS